ncbi:hypothetical protein KSP40_PGU009981 [Platanthera guangdongensis]|uniref:Uncharacterized protein n=1 Tax=Platanthera guangdongensis TaxID=2320717 RepID=A0ABR2ML23_9ASPA
MCSTLIVEQIASWRGRYNIPSSLEVKIPQGEQRVQSPPVGWMTLCESSLKVGLRFPPCEEFTEILKHCGVSASQFTLLAMTRIMGLIVFFREHGSRFSLKLFKEWCDVRADGGDRIEVHSNKTWLVFESQTDRRHGNSVWVHPKSLGVAQALELPSRTMSPNERL